ncbi:MAG: family 43 glycosylhydrolase [Chitinivibrionales bacterium]|nr:family 43 glycosylhydrolase [Chitinivibrionales bacterium]
MTSPTQCAYAPPGEYMKDHSFVLHDGWYHLFNISGTAGYYHGYTGNEETVAWSISRNLVDWELRGHVLHASQREGNFDQHEIWAPFCYKSDRGFFMYYTGIVHPHRPMEYRRLGHGHPWVFDGHRETQGIARSDDMTDWVKVSDPRTGSGVPGRDSHVVHDPDNGRFLLYSTVGTRDVHVSASTDLVNWRSLGTCCTLPALTNADSRLGDTSGDLPNEQLHVAESITVMRHPLNGRWILLANWQWVLSDDPTRFDGDSAEVFDNRFGDGRVDLGFACEMIEHEGAWYRSGTFGPSDHWKLGFTEVAWEPRGAFRVVKPSVLAGT